VTAALVARGYNSHAYEIARKIAEQGQNPSPKELSELLKLMDFDSPMGEMKAEALAVFKELRAKGIKPDYSGYAALMHVSTIPLRQANIDCRKRRRHNYAERDC
jgi:hypothetical protein